VLVALHLVLASCAPREGQISPGGQRWTPGRLSVDVEHLPTEASPRPDAALLRRLSRRPSEAATPAARVEQLHERALLEIALGRSAEATRVLRVAIAIAPAARLSSDLAAAHLDVFLDSGSPYDLLAAVSFARRATVEDPSSSTAWFNYAKALAELRLRYLGAEAWESFLKLEADPKWLAEGEALRDELLRETLEESWRTRWAAANAPATRAQLVTALPERARMQVEALVAVWARSMLAGDLQTAGASITLAEELAARLADERGDDLLAASVAHIRGAPREGSSSLAAAHERFALAAEAYSRESYATAEDGFRAAAKALQDAGSPYSRLAQFQAALCRYFSSTADAQRELERQLELLPESYLYLRGRTYWLLGTIAVVQQRLRHSLDLYENAATLLERGAGGGASAFVQVLLAESYSNLGMADRGWRHRLRGLRLVPYAENPRRIVAMLTEAVAALRREDLEELAVPFIEEAIRVAEADGSPLLVAQSHLEAAELAVEGRSRATAATHLEVTRQALESMEPSGLRSQLEHWRQLVDGLSMIEHSPEPSIAIMAAAYARQAASGYQFDRIRFLTERAKALRKLGRNAEARSDLESAIAEYESSSLAPEPGLRSIAYQRAQASFDDLLDLLVSTGSDAAPALLVAERAKARLAIAHAVELGLLDPDRFASPSAIQEALRVGRLVEFAVLPERLLRWTVSRNGLELAVTPIAASALEQRIEEFRNLVATSNDVASFEEIAEELFDLLFDGLELGADDEPLYVVPDRHLLRLPFAALRSGAREAFLIELHPLAVIPSATLALRRSPAQGRRLRDVAVVALPGDASTLPAGMPTLPYVSEEVDAIVRIYGSHSRVLGLEAFAGPEPPDLSSIGVAHLAGHFSPNAGDPLESGLVVPNANREMRLLTVRQLLAANLDSARLVVISACDSAEERLFGRVGALGAAGLLQASGVEQIVASHWSANDRDTAHMMTWFHGSYAKTGDALTAWRTAVLEALAVEEGPPPSAWANFFVVTSLMKSPAPAAAAGSVVN
jgi:CHAT domain-containing protein